jgi:DNA-binding FrmR family transcriptional regulator
VDSSSSQNRVTLALRRSVVTILGAIRRVLASIFQVVFNDRLRDISQKTDRLGSASVESVTHLGSEVRALDRRLARIEGELTALRELLERRERTSEPAEDPEEIRSAGA